MLIEGNVLVHLDWYQLVMRAQAMLRHLLVRYLGRSMFLMRYCAIVTTRCNLQFVLILNIYLLEALHALLIVYVILRNR